MLFPKTPKKKKPSVAKLKKKLWTLFSEYIRRLYARPDGMCECVTLGALSLGSITYALSTRESLQARVERENRNKLIECLDRAGEKPTTEEILRAKTACAEDILVKIIVPNEEASSATGSDSPVPPKGKQKIETSHIVKPVGGHDEEGNEVSQNYEKSISAQSAKRPITNFWKTYDLAIPLIRKYEGPHLRAYPDYKGCSIGWGTRAKSCKEVITQAEADKRLGSIVKQVISRVSKDFPTLNEKQQAGLVSFAYNCHKGYVDVVKNGLGQHKFWCRTAGGSRLQGLVNRRLEEQNLIFQ